MTIIFRIIISLPQKLLAEFSRRDVRERRPVMAASRETCLGRL